MLEAFYTFIQAYFVYITGYTLLFSVAGLFYCSLSAPAQHPQPHRIAILIPVYLENEVILQSIKYIKRQEYSSRFYDVFVLADSLATDTLCKLREENIHVVEIDFEQRTKAKAISRGLAYAQTINNYDITVILDADNVMDKHFLSIINQAYASGHMAIQGQRVAKNKNNSIAILDGISEAVNNAIYRKGYQALNLSVPVIGSGMAFDTQLLTSAFQEIDLNSKGEDRELQLEIIGRGQKIYYTDKALVFDEKVDQKQAFRQQRKRWILNQFISLVNSFPSSVKQLLHGNLSYFNIAFLSAIQLPRLINLGLFCIWVFLLWLLDRNIGFAILTFGLYVLSIIIAVPRGYYNKKTLSALAQLPQTFGIMLLSLFNAREANRRFIHTSHSTKHKMDL